MHEIFKSDPLEVALTIKVGILEPRVQMSADLINKPGRRSPYHAALGNIVHPGN